MKGNLACIKILLQSEFIRSDTVNVYPGFAKQGEDLPYISVFKQNTNPFPSKQSSSKLDEDEVSVQVNAVTYDEARNLADNCRVALDEFMGTIDGIEIQEAFFDNENDFVEHEASRPVYVIEQLYMVREKRTPEAILY